MKNYPPKDDVMPTMPKKTKLFVEYFTDIVSAASMVKLRDEYEIPIICRMQSQGKKRCNGKLIVCRKSKPPEIHWRCQVCKNNGIIKNWQGTKWNLRKRTNRSVMSIYYETLAKKV